MDKFVEKILNQKLQEGKLSLTEFNCIVNYIEKLIDKEIAKKPSIWGDGYDDKGNIIYDMYDCPKCGKSYEIDYEKYDHCPKCGQRIDWSDKEWKN